MKVKGLVRLYGFGLPRALVIALRDHDSSLAAYLYWFWHSKTFRTSGKLRSLDRPLVALLSAAMLAQIIAGVYLLVDWARFGSVGEWAFGLALLISYPLVVAHALALGLFVWHIVYYLFHPKKLGKVLLARILEHQVKRLRRKHHFTVVAVAGSVGKTSTKMAIAELLGQNLRVRYQSGNYNDRVTVPLVFFNQTEPSVLNIFAWARIIGENTASVEHPYPYDVVVVELGTDGPGQMKHFAYIKPDITVLTAVTPEHMAFFGTLDAVAQEELTVFDYSKQVLVNGDDVPGKYLIGRTFQEYSTVTDVAHNYYAVASKRTLGGQHLAFEFPVGKLQAQTAFVGEQGARIVLAAAATADMLGMHRDIIAESVAALSAFPGRMQILPGIKESVLIDDTYNASPEAVLRALDALYAAKAPQRIAILGSMGELGAYAKQAHHMIGEYCDPHKVDLVVTVGADARRWLAPAAKARGCQVKSFKSPYDAGEFVRKQLKSKAVVLAKGSQNRIFTEEAIKQLLAHPADVNKLVRQSKYWLRIKAKQFDDATL